MSPRKQGHRISISLVYELESGKAENDRKLCFKSSYLLASGRPLDRPLSVIGRQLTLKQSRSGHEGTWLVKGGER